MVHVCTSQRIKVGERSLKQDKDLRTGELPQPMKGYRKYEGYSPKYDITIRFLYNLIWIL